MWFNWALDPIGLTTTGLLLSNLTITLQQTFVHVHIAEMKACS